MDQKFSHKLDFARRTKKQMMIMTPRRVDFASWTKKKTKINRVESSLQYGLGEKQTEINPHRVETV